MNSERFHCAIIGAGELARLFGIPLVKAHQLMRQKGFPHLKIGRQRLTTEPLLAGWMAVNVKNPPAPTCFDPLERAVVERAAWVVGELVKDGRLRVAPVQTQGEAVAEGCHI